MVDPVPLGYKIERRLRNRVQQLADNAGVSGAVMLEFIIEHTEVTTQGLPAGWPVNDRDGELPIDVP
jgi:hypothetical protein